MRPDDAAHLRRAYHEASLSEDPRTQTGAVLVGADGLVAARDRNRFPRGVRPRTRSPEKYSYIEHAERNVIYAAARTGVRTEGLVMYCTWFACCDCARAIIEAGVSEVVGHDHEVYKARPDWQEDIDRALGMLTEAGVKHRHVKADLGVSIVFAGERVSL